MVPRPGLAFHSTALSAGRRDGPGGPDSRWSLDATVIPSLLIQGISQAITDQWCVTKRRV